MSDSEERTSDIDSEEDAVEVGEFVSNIFEKVKELDYPLSYGLIRDFYSTRSTITPKPGGICILKKDTSGRDTRVIVKNEDCNLMSVIESQFEQWGWYISGGFNICLYGIGSKIVVLDRFHEYLQNWTRVKVKPLAPTFTFRKFVNELKNLFRMPEGLSIGQFLARIRTHESLTQHCCIFLYNIDSKNILDYLEALAEIASHPDIRLITCVDNYKLFSSLSLSALNKFNFTYSNTSTYHNYHEEITYSRTSIKPSHAMMRSSQAAVKAILRSMTDTQRKILAQLRNAQPNDKGMPWRQFVNCCLDEMLVYNEKQLKDHLVEAKDHRLLVEKRGPNNEIIVQLKIPAEVDIVQLIC